jgi:hypothetical protein
MGTARGRCLPPPLPLPLPPAATKTTATSTAPRLICWRTAGRSIIVAGVATVSPPRQSGRLAAREPAGNGQQRQRAALTWGSIEKTCRPFLFSHGVKRTHSHLVFSSSTSRLSSAASAPKTTTTTDIVLYCTRPARRGCAPFFDSFWIGLLSPDGAPPI